MAVSDLHKALNASIVAAEKYLSLRLEANELDKKEAFKAASERNLARAETVKERINTKKCISQLNPQERILLKSSRIQNNVFPPWKADPSDEDFTSELFVDASGLPALSISQEASLRSWSRPKDIWSSPRITSSVDSDAGISLVQNQLSNCSIVASFCAAAERRNGSRDQLSQIVFPHGTKDGSVSENGKYVVKLLINGCYRRVVVDDFLPMSAQGPIFTVSQSWPELIWPAILEKAYLKVMGGYDFPGSNSAMDLYAFTGWIPEHVFPHSEDFNIDRVWKRVYRAFKFEDVLVTLGTGKLTPKATDIGLVANHNYSVLDMMLFHDRRLMLVKNPWAASSDLWKLKGPEILSSKVGPTERGCEWIEFEHVCRYWERMYLNWNPELFKFHQDVHFTAEVQDSADDDVSSRMQYTFRNTTDQQICLWALISRHTSSLKPLPGYLSLHMFDSATRVHGNQKPFQEAPLLDSPQRLVRLHLGAQLSATAVLVTEDLPAGKYNYTLSTYSREQVIVSEASSSFLYSAVAESTWTSQSNGGGFGNPDYNYSPQFALDVSGPSDVLFRLSSDVSTAVNVHLLWGTGVPSSKLLLRDIVCSSPEYQLRKVLVEAHIRPGKYTLVCSTFEPGVGGEFRLNVQGTQPFTLRPLANEKSARLQQSQTLDWHGGKIINFTFSGERLTTASFSLNSAYSAIARLLEDGVLLRVSGNRAEKEINLSDVVILWGKTYSLQVERIGVGEGVCELTCFTKGIRITFGG